MPKEIVKLVTVYQYNELPIAVQHRINNYYISNKDKSKFFEEIKEYFIRKYGATVIPSFDDHKLGLVITCTTDTDGWFKKEYEIWNNKAIYYFYETKNVQKWCKNNDMWFDIEGNLCIKGGKIV